MALRRWDEIAPQVRAGVQALKGVHRVLMGRPTDYNCSIDLDEARRVAEPNANRWDYILGDRARASIGVEVHPAKASEVDTIVSKKKWAQERLAAHCGLRVTRWCWLRPLKSRLQFTQISPKARILAQNGIEFPASRLR